MRVLLLLSALGLVNVGCFGSSDETGGHPAPGSPDGGADAAGSTGDATVVALVDAAVDDRQTSTTSDDGAPVLVEPLEGGPCEAGLRSCAAARGACVASCLDTLVASNLPYGVATDAQNVYWTDLHAGTVSKAPLAGGPVTVLATGQGITGGIAVSPTSVYWMSSASDPSIMTVAIAGGPAHPFTVAATGLAGQRDPRNLVVYGADLYWAEGRGILKAPLDGVPDGGAPVRLTTAFADALAVGPGGVYFTDGAGTLLTIPLDGLPDGGDPTQLASATDVGGIAIDATGIYLTAYCGEFLMKAPLAGVPEGGTPPTLATAASGPCSAGSISTVVVDDSSVYWNGARVYRTPLAGGTPVVLTPDSGGSSVWPRARRRTPVLDRYRHRSCARARRQAAAAGQRASRSPSPLHRTTHTAWLSTRRTSTSHREAESVIASPLAGGTPTLVAWADMNPTGIVTHGSTVYWTNNVNPGAVFSAPTAGLAAGAQPATVASGASYPAALATDGTDLFWSEGNGATVSRAPLDGGAGATPVASGLSSADGVVADAAGVYWTTYSGGNGSIQGRTASGAALTFPTVQAHPMGIALDSTTVYWTNDDGTVLAAPRGGGGALTTVASAQDHPTDIAADGANVYWMNVPGSRGQAVLMKAPRGGGAGMPIASHLTPRPGSLRLDGASVYFISTGPTPDGYLTTGGAVLRLTPK